MPCLVQLDTSFPIFLTQYFLIIIFTPVIKTSPSDVINSNQISVCEQITSLSFDTHEASITAYGRI